jgi:hypothetical protein
MQAGLCDSCRHQKVVRNTRGSSFSMCERAKFDVRYPKYPRLPVERCPGWERREEPGRGGSSRLGRLRTDD